MKIKKPIDFANPTAKTYYQLVSLIQEYGKINELNVKLTNLKTTNQALKAEINMLNDKLSTIQNKYNSNETKVANLSNELNIKAKELNDITKSHKNEIKTLMEEVKRIKETWTPHEKKMEYITTIEELEKHPKTEYAITMFFVINATSIQLLPTSVMSLRTSLNSLSPSDIILPTILTTLLSSIIGIILVKTFCKKPREKQR